MANEQRPPAGIGCLSTVLGAVVLIGVVVLVFFVGFLALAVVAALVLVGLVVWGVDRLLLAVSPKRRARRDEAQRAFLWQFGRVQGGDAGPFGPSGAAGPFGPPGEVIDTTATDAPTDPSADRAVDGDPDQLGPG